MESRKAFTLQTHALPKQPLSKKTKKDKITLLNRIQAENGKSLERQNSNQCKRNEMTNYPGPHNYRKGNWGTQLEKLGRKWHAIQISFMSIPLFRTSWIKGSMKMGSLGLPRIFWEYTDVFPNELPRLPPHMEFPGLTHRGERWPCSSRRKK